MSTVELRDFGWRHAGRRAWAVRGIDLRVESGERVLLLGASGAGKSTLLAALAGLLAEDSGEQEGTVEVDGLDPRGKARDRIGIVFQDPETQLVMARAGDDVAFGLENRGVPAEEIWPRVDGALRRVGFPYARSRPTAALSGGEQQRLALAGALALRPGLLLLDEPTANLDPAGAALVRTAIGGALDADTTLILVEHRVADALPLVDRVVVLEPGGGIRADGPPGAVFGTRGEALAAAGVWVPGRPVPPRPATAAPGEPLLTAERLGLPPRLAATDLVVRAGEALAVLGPNGAGKSTLALLLGGLLRPGTGRVAASPELAGRESTAPHRWRAPALTRRIGSVFQDPEHQFVTATVFDELALGPRRIGRPEPAVRSTVDELLGRLRLERLAGANPYTLSGGEARRLSVATALATAPRLLVLDEPTFGQDRRTWIELVDLLADLRDAGHGILAVTHDADFVAALADRTLTLPSPHPTASGTDGTLAPGPIPSGPGGVVVSRPGTGGGTGGAPSPVGAARRHETGEPAGGVAGWPGSLAGGLAGDAPLARRNPVAKLAAALVFSLALVATLDPVAPTVAIAIELAVLPFFGIRYTTLARRAWPLLASALGIVLTVLLFAADRTGTTLLSAGPVTVTTGVLATALGLALRMISVALPGVLVFGTTDPTDLADALIQNAKASPRFAIGALAAFRLVPLLALEWQMISMARRARGVDAGRNPLARLRLFGSTAFALLVGAIRRGTRLATAMDARGFDAGLPRTLARRQRFGYADAALIAGAAVLAGAALATSILLGTFRPLIG